jgi:plastocyanin
MRKDTRERLVLPILLPLGIMLLIAGVLFGFSRILLSVQPHAATSTALVVALSIVVFAALAAGRPQVRFSTVAAMSGAVAGVAMLAGGIALLAFAPVEEHPSGGGGPTATVQLVAKNIQFVQQKLIVPASAPFAIDFQNDDPQTQHNVQIFDTKDFSGSPLFSGDLVTGVAKATYEVGALDPGTYYFHCEVHPTMTGTIQAKPGTPPGGPGESPGGPSPSGPGASGPGGPAGGSSVTVVAQNLQFDTGEIDLSAGQPSTITFENKDAGTPHNIAIFTDESQSQVLFRGSVVTGVTTTTYDVPPLDAGTYYFHCDVHPTMNGSVTVK